MDVYPNAGLINPFRFFFVYPSIWIILLTFFFLFLDYLCYVGHWFLASKCMYFTFHLCMSSLVYKNCWDWIHWIGVRPRIHFRSGGVRVDPNTAKKLALSLNRASSDSNISLPLSCHVSRVTSRVESKTYVDA